MRDLITWTRRTHRTPYAVATIALLIGCGHGPGGTNEGTPDPLPPSLDVRRPPPMSAGRSTIESRYVYASPDEGELTIPLSVNFSLPGEFSIQEASMVAGSATVHVAYSKSHNTVDVRLEAHGLPYRPTFMKEVDDSTLFNRQLTKVADARWQLWLIGTSFGREHEDVYYMERPPRTFLGSRYDFEPLGTRSLPLRGLYETRQGSARQMVGSPLFDPEPNGEVTIHFTFPYDRITDEQGTPGTLNMLLPADTCKPDTLLSYWTETVLPPEKLMTWDTFLSSIWNGEGIGFALTAEPASKPAELARRSSTFTGWANVYPAAVPPGFGMDFLTFGTVVPIRGSSYQLDLWPQTSRRTACRP